MSNRSIIIESMENGRNPIRSNRKSFTQDLFKKLKYDPPSRSTLSGRPLDAEVARVTNLVNKEIDHCNNLTLSFSFAALKYRISRAKPPPSDYVDPSMAL
ncbi:5927_t:CDS:2 [Ambispora leptoticha]|uniref:5927_t:CDS:1 n=1 Tax=Ambispora leptoticha TaxID=144679 RepID=A0A9N9F2Q0_9GLOM|nr:5927_t:CDS:2 [Ambispora leptoticha]